MTFYQSIKICFSKYFTMSGRATRPEFWYFQIFIFAGAIAAIIMDVSLYGYDVLDTEAGGPFYILFGLVTFFPAFTVAVRRLHDVGKPFYYMFAPVITFGIGIFAGAQFGSYWGEGAGVVVFAIMICGPAYLLLLLTRRSEDGENKYGPSQYAS